MKAIDAAEEALSLLRAGHRGRYDIIRISPRGDGRANVIMHGWNSQVKSLLSRCKCDRVRDWLLNEAGIAEDPDQPISRLGLIKFECDGERTSVTVLRHSSHNGAHVLVKLDSDDQGYKRHSLSIW